MCVFLLDTNKVPQPPVSHNTAERLLKAGQAAVFRRYPLTLILKDSVDIPSIPSLRLKIDPGSKVTGLALLDENRIIWAAELTHRGSAIKKALHDRAALRRGRRYRKTRYRHPKFPKNQKNTLSGGFSRDKGWLPPSLMHRVHTTLTWVRRLCRYAPIAAVSYEMVKFDTQRLERPEVSGVEYQRGELFGYEVREYLLEKWHRKCAYCGAENVPLEIEHIIPKAKGGSDRVSNLALACRKCNQKKGAKTAAEFGHPEVQKKAKMPLRDAAMMNATRYLLGEKLKEIEGIDVEYGSGGRTKFNRRTQGMNKAHWIDAACVGASTPENLQVDVDEILEIRCTGHGRRQRAQTDKYGFPKTHCTRQKSCGGFKTGDMARAYVPATKTKPERSAEGRVVVTPSMGRAELNKIVIDPETGKPKKLRPSFKVEFLTMVHAADGYDYSVRKIEINDVWEELNHPNQVCNG